jgi:hypothetical protein
VSYDNRHEYGVHPAHGDHGFNHGMDAGQMKAMFAKQGKAISTSKTPKATHAKLPSLGKKKPTLMAPKVETGGTVKTPHLKGGHKPKEEGEKKGGIGKSLGELAKGVKAVVKEGSKAVMASTGTEPVAGSFKEKHHFGLTHSYGETLQAY